MDLRLWLHTSRRSLGSSWGVGVEGEGEVGEEGEDTRGEVGLTDRQQLKLLEYIKPGSTLRPAVEGEGLRAAEEERDGERGREREAESDREKEEEAEREKTQLSQHVKLWRKRPCCKESRHLFCLQL